MYLNQTRLFIFVGLTIPTILSFGAELILKASGVGVFGIASLMIIIFGYLYWKKIDEFALVLKQNPNVKEVYPVGMTSTYELTYKERKILFFLERYRPTRYRTEEPYDYMNFEIQTQGKEEIKEIQGIFSKRLENTRFKSKIYTEINRQKNGIGIFIKELERDLIRKEMQNKTFDKMIFEILDMAIDSIEASQKN
jgi:hypothetical protein